MECSKISNWVYSLLYIAMFTGCAGKYMVKTYPSGAKVYTQDIKSNDKKFIGLSPIQIEEESQLGDVFFVVVEKERYKPKSVMVRVNPGESLSISAQLDPKNPDDLDPKNALAKNDEDKDGEKKDDGPKPPPKPEEKKKKENAKLDELMQEIAELNLRVALLENTTEFYKDAMFSSRFAQGGVAKFDRDHNESVIENMFEAQKAIGANNLDKAMTFIDKAIAKDAYITNAWLLKGSINFLRKDYDGAKKSWERSLKLDPYNKIALKYLNNVYKKLGRNELMKKPRVLRRPAAIKELEKRQKARLQ